VEACSVYQDLLGTRIAVANAELRIPLIRALVVGPIGFPPIEAFGFYDAGVAWDENTTPVFRRGVQEDLTERGILTSLGGGARINLLGYAVLEVAYVRPFDQYREKPWHWQFTLQPGF
jgi:outer membrane protein assembly factor BamA